MSQQLTILEMDGHPMTPEGDCSISWVCREQIGVSIANTNAMVLALFWSTLEQVQRDELKREKRLFRKNENQPQPTSA